LTDTVKYEKIFLRLKLPAAGNGISALLQQAAGNVLAVAVHGGYDI
jgi:hypothetical protein